MFELKVGDKIYIQSDDDEWEITKIDKFALGNPPMYQVQKKEHFGKTVSKWIWESEIEAISELIDREKPTSGCECGITKAYSNKAKAWMHSTWCPLYRKGAHE